jgi:hypothetical protein
MKIKNATQKIFSGLALSSLLLFSCSSGDNENHAENPANKSALVEIRKEPKVKEAVLTAANVLYVSVEDDGTNRNGYAQYICEILTEHKATTKWVKIVKVNSMNDPNKDNAYGVLLGEAQRQ